MTNTEYQLELSRLYQWNELATGPNGCTFQTIGRVSSNIVTVCTNRPESLISGAPNRVPGTVIYWTALVDHDNKYIAILAIEPDPRPGL